MYPNNGSIISYGYDFSSGYFTVRFLEGSEVNTSIIDEIYKVHETEGQKRQIKDIGVVFEYTELLMTDEEQPNKSTPGFTALTLLLSLSFVMWLRRG
jgi:hypothetical protein